MNALATISAPATALEVEIAKLREDLAAQAKLTEVYRGLYQRVLDAGINVIRATGGSLTWQGESGAAFAKLEDAMGLPSTHDTANALLEAQSGIGM